MQNSEHILPGLAAQMLGQLLEEILQMPFPDLADVLVAEEGNEVVPDVSPHHFQVGPGNFLLLAVLVPNWRGLRWTLRYFLMSKVPWSIS